AGGGGAGGSPGRGGVLARGGGDGGTAWGRGGPSGGGGLNPTSRVPPMTTIFMTNFPLCTAERWMDEYHGPERALVLASVQHPSRASRRGMRGVVTVALQ